MIHGIIREHEQYKDDPTKNPTYSFKTELRKMGEVTLETPIEFTSENVLITGFDVAGVKIQNNVINKSYDFKWEQIGILFSRKIYEIVKNK